MTREEIKQWFDDRNKVGDSFRLDTEDVSIDALVALAQAVTAAEREACAKVCEDLTTIVMTSEWADGTLDCATAIRARGDR